MKHIGELFSRYKKTIKPPQATVTKEFVVVCEAVTGIPIKPEQCVYTVATKTIYLQTPSLVKSELLQKKPALLAALKAKLGPNAPTNII
jgi:hypothetical protein